MKKGNRRDDASNEGAAGDLVSVMWEGRAVVVSPGAYWRVESSKGKRIKGD